MTYIHAPVRVVLPDRNEVRVEIDNSERVVPIPSGAQGLPGEPGFSPIVSVDPITGGNRVTITDADGDTSFDVMNGAQGEQGEPGEGVPAGGAQGQVLKKASNADFDTVWANESGTVLSVNGMTGAVVLDADDVGALPVDTFIPTKTSDLTNDSGFVNASQAAAAAPVRSVNGATGAVTVPTPTYNQTNITSGTHDLNDYTTPGLYYFSSGATLSNAPNSAVNGWLWVLKSTGNQFKQIWVRHGSNPNTTKDFYMRFYSGSWSDWFGWMNSWKLLWTNASPSSAFGAQTISLDLSNYDFIIVRGMYYNYFPNSDMSWHIFKVGETYTQAMACMRGDGSEFSRRLVTVSTSGLTFSNGGINVSGVSGDRVAIPEEIYGIKGVNS